MCWCSFRAPSFAALILHATHKHGYRRLAYSYLTESGDCLSCLRGFHTKSRFLGHLTRSKHYSCLNRLIAHYPPTHDAATRAKYGKASTGNAVHRGGPPRDEDRWPIRIRQGPVLPEAPLQAPMGPSSLAYSLVDRVGSVPSRPYLSSLAFLVQGALARLFLTIDFFILNLCCGDRRCGDLADLCSRVAFPIGFKSELVCI